MNIYSLSTKSQTNIFNYSLLMGTLEMLKNDLFLLREIL